MLMDPATRIISIFDCDEFIIGACLVSLWTIGRCTTIRGGGRTIVKKLIRLFPPLSAFRTNELQMNRQSTERHGFG